MNASINPIQKIEANNQRIQELDRERDIHLIRAIAWQLSKDNGRDSIEESMIKAKQIVNHHE